MAYNKSMLPIPLVIFNAVALTVVIVLAILMARWGYTFTQNVGDSVIGGKMQWRILKSLLALLAITVLAALLNTLYAAS